MGVVDVVDAVDVVDMDTVGMEAMDGGLEGEGDPDGDLGVGGAGGDHNGTLAGSRLTHGSRSLPEDAKMAALI